ncbi:hypothetical protein FACS189434_06830 [Bacteroidia bacterium]|nr:hypothetical protein FACS189434_06830 [Bacteroidia bacterium]
MIYNTNSMQEALALANKLKKDEAFELFRGHASKDWEIVSSASRISDDLRDDFLQKIANFYSFCKKNNILKSYIDSDKDDKFIAIAQHYGLCTNFLDFTSSPEIAMYFATHDKCCKVGEKCVIVCLNKKEFEHEVNNGYTNYILSKQNLPIPRIVECDIKNLWRLNAQKGCFIELPYINYDKIYGFDKIYFPYSEPFNDIKDTDIYPERKSPIEIELDKFFMDIRMIENSKTVKTFPNVVQFDVDLEPTLEQKNKIFKDFSKLSAHSSWKNIDNEWVVEKQIEWKYEGNRNQIQIDCQKLIDNDSDYLNKLTGIIDKHRNELINLEVINADNFISRNLIGYSGSKPIFTNSKITISGKIKTMFDGMNILPYSNEQIVNAISELLNIELHFEEINKINVEFLENIDGKGYYSRACILKDDYRNLLRDDILTYLNSEYLSTNPNFEDIMLLGCDMSFVSDFNKFVDLFAKRIIPFQIFLNRNPILFNPAKIKIFGKP